MPTGHDRPLHGEQLDVDEVVARSAYVVGRVCGTDHDHPDTGGTPPVSGW